MDKLEADVIVVAAGPAGLAAALSAAQKGARVLVFEKAATTGGAGNMAAGLLAVESRHQRRKNIGPTREEAFKIFMDHTHWRVDARLVKAYLDKSGRHHRLVGATRCVFCRAGDHVFGIASHLAPYR